MMHVANSIKLRNLHAVTIIIDLIDPCSSGFMNARIRRVDHDGALEKQVKYADLLPIGTLFPQKCFQLLSLFMLINSISLMLLLSTC